MVTIHFVWLKNVITFSKNADEHKIAFVNISTLCIWLLIFGNCCLTEMVNGVLLFRLGIKGLNVLFARPGVRISCMFCEQMQQTQVNAC